MFYLFIVLALVYIVLLLQLAMKGSKNSIKRTHYNQNINVKYMLITQFSSKPDSGLISLMFIALLFAGCLFVMHIVGYEDLNISKSAYIAIIGVSWIGFVYLAVASLLYGWIRLATCGENLIVSDEKIVGTSVTISGLNIELNDFDINTEDVTEVIIVKGEKKLGLEFTSLNIRTADHNYEFLMPVDAEGTKAVIEKRMSV